MSAHILVLPVHRKKDGQSEQALGRSRGGFRTKLHIVVDALGNPLNILLTAGQRHDISQAEALLTDYIGDYVIADRGDDSALHTFTGRGR